VKKRDPRERSLASITRRATTGGEAGWNHWRAVWAAWCPGCRQETMPFASGRCGFCDTHLRGQPTRGPYDPPLACGLARPDAATPSILNDTDLKAA
jgi:hypothetical protein